jgi:hypothetical protein
LRPEGGIEPDLNGFLHQKQSASTAGRVEPQLNGFEGGFEPDLNYFFPSQRDLTPESGIKSKGTFDLDLFSQPRWSSGSKMPSVFLGTVDAQRPFEFDSFRLCDAVTLRFLTLLTNYLITQSLITHYRITNIELSNIASLPDHLSIQSLITRFLIPQSNGFLSQWVGVELESNCSRITVFMRYPQAIHSLKLPPLNPAARIKIDHQNILIGFGGGREGACQVNKKDARHIA